MPRDSAEDEPRNGPPEGIPERRRFPRPDPRERWRQAYGSIELPDRHEVRQQLRRLQEEGKVLAQRGRDLARRYQRPLVGAALMAASLPLAKSAQEAGQAEAEATTRRAPTPQRGVADIEEQVGEVWASARGQDVRASMIERAIERYGISRDLAEDIHDEAVRAGIEPEVAFGLVNTESSFRHRAVSHVGARGLTQVMPRTARWLQPGVQAEDLFDRTTNLRLGFRYLRDLIDKYDGDMKLALLAYNRGPGTVDRVLARGGNPDNGYADRVLRG